MVHYNLPSLSQIKNILMFLLAAGFALSLIGSLPPGLISLTVSQTSLVRGLAAAMALLWGAVVAEFFQACAAVLLTDWFLNHPGAERWFHWAGIPVFLLLGIYLVFWAKAPHIPEQYVPASLHKQFAKGLILSTFNLLAIPYWFVYCGWLRVEGWWTPGMIPMLIFALGVSIGTLCALSLYAWLGQLILRRYSQMAKYANLLVGLIFIGLGLKVLWNLLLG